MGYGDEKVIVQVTEGKGGELDHTSPDGKKRTYYPARQNWLDLHGWRQLPWPVDDNYLGRLKAYAGRVREAGLL